MWRRKMVDDQKVIDAVMNHSSANSEQKKAFLESIDLKVPEPDETFTLTADETRVLRSILRHSGWAVNSCNGVKDTLVRDGFAKGDDYSSSDPANLFISIRTKLKTHRR